MATCNATLLRDKLKENVARINHVNKSRFIDDS